MEARSMSRWPSDVDSPRTSSTDVGRGRSGARRARRCAPRGRSSATPASAASCSAIGSPSPAFLPSRSTVTRSAIASTSSSLWLTKTMATPSSRSLRSSANSAAVSCSVIEAVGSSRSRHLRFERQRLGDLDDLHLRDRQRAHLGPGVDVAVEQVEPAPRLAVDRCRSRSGRACVGRRSSRMFSPTEKRGMRLRSWCTTPMPAAIASRGEAKRDRAAVEQRCGPRRAGRRR